MDWRTKRKYENIAFFFIAGIVIIGVLYLFGGIFSSVGYVVMLLSGAEWSFGRGIAAGLGSLILIGVSGAAISGIIRAMRG